MSEIRAAIDADVFEGFRTQFYADRVRGTD
jgi:hypothetical protein